MNNKWDIQCDSCGRFILGSELDKGGGASSVFIPDSEVSQEENRFRCKKCTEEKGCIESYQFSNVKNGYIH